MACWVLGASPRPLKLCLHLVEIFEVAHVAFRQSHQHRGEGQTQITLIDRMLGPQTLRRGGEKGVATPPCCGALGLARVGGPRTRHSHDESLRPIQAPGCINHIAVGKRFLALAIGKARVPRIANRQTRVIWRNRNWPLCIAYGSLRLQEHKFGRWFYDRKEKNGVLLVSTQEFLHENPKLLCWANNLGVGIVRTAPAAPARMLSGAPHLHRRLSR